MGYDHFALISLAEQPTDTQLKEIKKVCKKLRKKYSFDNRDPLFGEVHHLTGGSFNDYTWELFDAFMLDLYKKTKIDKIYLWVCEFDGETMNKFLYEKGSNNSQYNVEIQFNDNDINTISFDIESVSIKRNITIFYNDDYCHDYSPY